MPDCFCSILSHCILFASLDMCYQVMYGMYGMCLQKMHSVCEDTRTHLSQMYPVSSSEQPDAWQQSDIHSGLIFYRLPQLSINKKMELLYLLCSWQAISYFKMCDIQSEEQRSSSHVCLCCDNIAMMCLITITSEWWTLKHLWSATDYRTEHFSRMWPVNPVCGQHTADHSAEMCAL